MGDAEDAQAARPPRHDVHQQRRQLPALLPLAGHLLHGRVRAQPRFLWNNYPEGGYYRFDGSEALPVWLHRAGYETIHIGKYLNEYG